LLETERLLLRRPSTGDGKFEVVLRGNGVVVGRVGIQLLDPETWQPSAGGRPELGWTIWPEHRGHGYATEAARAVRDWHGREGLVSLIPPDNLPSQAVARRLGAVPGREVHLPRDGTFVIWEH
jgi:RimJ/RimL family protein N-acetyltransferase